MLWAVIELSLRSARRVAAAARAARDSYRDSQMRVGELPGLSNADIELLLNIKPDEL